MKLSDTREFELVPEGVYTARCIRHIDGGTQEIDYLGNVSYKRQLRLTWELLDDEIKMKDGKPFGISKTYTASLNPKASLRRDLEAWRGKKFTEEELKGFDSKNLLDSYCTVQVVHKESSNGNTYANINAIMAAKKPYPKGVNPTIYWSYDEVDPEVFAHLTPWEKEYVGKAEEWYPSIAQKAAEFEQKEAENSTRELKKSVAQKEVVIEDIPDDQEEVDKRVDEAADQLGGTKLTQEELKEVPY